MGRFGFQSGPYLVSVSDHGYFDVLVGGLATAFGAIRRPLGRDLIAVLNLTRPRDVEPIAYVPERDDLNVGWEWPHWQAVVDAYCEAHAAELERTASEMREAWGRRMGEPLVVGGETFRRGAIVRVFSERDGAVADEGRAVLTDVCDGGHQVTLVPERRIVGERATETVCRTDGSGNWRRWLVAEAS